MKLLTDIATADESDHPLYSINSHLENCRVCVLLIAFRQILEEMAERCRYFAREHLWRR